MTNTTNNTTKKLTVQEWENLVKENPTNKRIKEICEKYGYEASNGYIAFNTPTIGIRPLDWKNGRYPDVMISKPIFAKEINPKERHWEINACSSGNRTAREFKLLMFQFNQALRMVEELEELDLATLPIRPEEFDD